jgi:hypothetical protein
MKSKLALIGLMTVALATPGLSQTNPLLGTWKLNVAKSPFLGPSPKTGVTTFAPDAQGVVKNSGGGIGAQGQETSTHSPISTMESRAR